MRKFERYNFSNLNDLRDWLNRFDETKLDEVLPENGTYFTLDWHERKLSDGSTVQEAQLATH